MGSPFTPSHKPDHTDRPSVNVNNVDDEDEEIVEERSNVGIGGGIQTHTSRPHSPHDTNVLDEDDGEHHDPSIHDGDDEDLKSSGSSGPEKMSLRRALFMYLMPLYMAWFGGIIVDML